MFKLFKRKPKTVNGLIGAWGLSDWWLSEFSFDEQNEIVNVLINSDMMERGNIYTEGNYYYDKSELPKDRKNLFLILAGWATHFQKPETNHIAFKLFKKAESLIVSDSDIVDLHYYYQNKIEVYYRNRKENPETLEIAIDACEKQIEIAPYVKTEIHKRDLEKFGSTRYDIHHVGFKQLRIIEEKRGNYQKAVELAKSALSQGWAGNWEKDIERIQKKRSK